MSRIEAIYLTPEYFCIDTQAQSLIYQVRHAYFPARQINNYGSDYLVARELRGKSMRNYFSMYNTLHIDIDDERYCVSFRNNERIFYRVSDNHILAKDKEWTHEEILAQNHGTIVRFAFECQYSVSNKISSDFRSLGCIATMYPGIKDMYYYHYWVQQDKAGEFAKLLAERNVPILEQTLIHPKLIKLL